MNLEAILQEQFLNKRVEVKTRARDAKGRIFPLHLNRYDIAAGVCTFIGKNELLDIPLQINLNNQPITVEHINHIELSVIRKPIRN